MIIELDVRDEVMDEFISSILLDLTKTLHSDILRLRNKKTLNAIQVEDLKYDLKTLKALKRVFKYTTTTDQWGKLDEFK